MSDCNLTDGYGNCRECEYLEKKLKSANERIAKLEKVRKVAKSFVDVIKPGHLNNYQDDFRDWLAKALKEAEK